jgi:hypothetical protein
MGQSCKICNDSRRISLDREICAGKDIKNLAKSYNVPYHSLYYHSQHHVTRQLATAMQQKEMTESFDLLHKIDKILSRTEKIFQRNFDKGKDTVALKALRESRGTLELLAKISVFMHQTRADELKNTKTSFTVTVAPDDAEDPMELASEKLSASEFETFLYLSEKINRVDEDFDQYEEFNYHEDIDQYEIPDPDPYQGVPHDLNVDPGPLKSIPIIEEEPEQTMKRTKKPKAQIPKQMEPHQIPGKQDVFEADICRKKMARRI